MPGAGIIVMWSGVLANIPTGWTLCDGTFGTPDLREKFIRGTPNGVDPGGEGGAATHVHNFTGSGHVHDIGAGTAISGGTGAHNVTDTGTASGTTQTGDSLPPFYNLAFVMKL